jgi:DedD protein
MAEKDFSIDNNNAAPDSQLVLKKRARRRLVGAIALALLEVIVLPMVMDQAPQPLTQDIQIRIPSQDPGATTFVSRMAPKLAPTPTPLPQDTDKVPTPTDAATPVPAVSAVHVAAPPLAAETQSEAQTSSKAAPKHEVKPETKPDTKTAPAKAATPAAPAPKAPAPASAPDKKPPAKPAVANTTEKAAESARAVALLNDEHWVVQLGAYRNAETVKSIATRIKALGLPAFTEKVDTPQGPSTRVRSGPFASREAADKAQERLKKNGIGAPLGGVVAQSQ